MDIKTILIFVGGGVVVAALAVVIILMLKRKKPATVGAAAYTAGYTSAQQGYIPNPPQPQQIPISPQQQPLPPSEMAREPYAQEPIAQASATHPEIVSKCLSCGGELPNPLPRFCPSCGTAVVMATADAINKTET